MGLWCPLSPDPEAPQEPQGPRERLERTENQEIQAKTAKLALKDLQDSQGPLETQASKERRGIVEKVNQDPEAPQDPLDPPDLDFDRRLWTWRDLGFLIWRRSGAPLDCLAPPAPLVSLVPPAPALLRALGRSDLQAETERLVHLGGPGCQGGTASRDTLDSREKREILEPWVDLEQLGKRATEDSLDCLGLQESLAWLDFLDQWDQWALQDPLAHPHWADPGPDLTIWKGLEGSDSLD